MRLSRTRSKTTLLMLQFKRGKKVKNELLLIINHDSPAVVEEDLTVEEFQTPKITQTPQKPMLIEEGHPVPAPATNTSASFHIPRMIIPEAHQSVTFDVMTHRPS